MRPAYWMVASMLTFSGCGLCGPPLEVVERVDLTRYMGLWYEVARYPNFFQLSCAGGTTAFYALRDDGKVDVTNSCRQGSLDGEIDEIEGVARVVDEHTNAKLKVRFGLFEGNYWIIGLDEDYQWAVVGEPTRNFLWILSRTPQLQLETYERILSLVEQKDYDPARLEKTPQPGD